jgi:peptidoglycan hydrolase-like protein with peptidoglycan-binding domain
MKRGVFFITAVFSAAFFCSGCATTRQSRELELQSLRNQITVLESQIQSREQEISTLKEALAKPVTAPAECPQAGKGKARLASAAKRSGSRAKNIQTALKNAKFYSGPIDGKIGPEARQAVIAFQKANKLRPDGRVGKKTWKLLKNYL